MTDQDKRCGTCKWWAPCDGAAPYGDCGIPTPECFDAEDKGVMHGFIGGTMCPCWEAKE